MAKAGLFKGAFTVSCRKGGSPLKNKFGVFGTVTGGPGYDISVLEGRGGASRFQSG